jgi:hypothetical protein
VRGCYFATLNNFDVLPFGEDVVGLERMLTVAGI